MLFNFTTRCPEILKITKQRWNDSGIMWLIRVHISHDNYKFREEDLLLGGTDPRWPHLSWCQQTLSSKKLWLSVKGRTPGVWLPGDAETENLLQSDKNRFIFATIYPFKSTSWDLWQVFWSLQAVIMCLWHVLTQGQWSLQKHDWSLKLSHSLSFSLWLTKFDKLHIFFD